MNNKTTIKSIYCCLSVLLATLYTNTASAYIFGPPNVTELAEVGEASANFGVFSRSEASTTAGSTAAESTGIAGVSKRGDKSGAFTFMYRLADYKFKAANRTGFDMGFGVGGEWNVLSDRSLGIIANFQNDIGIRSYSSNSNTETALTYGLEVGGLYRIFIDTSTIAPFVLYNQFYTSNKVNTGFTATSYTATITGNTTTFGIGVILGNITFSFSQSTSSANQTTTLSSVASNLSTKATMLTIGVNF